MLIKARKKPIEIEAMQFTENNMDRVYHWISCNHYADFDSENQPVIRIQTLEGVMTANLGDYIICGVAGEYYPCKSDIFFKTYDIEDKDQ